MPITVIESPTEQQTIEIFSGVASSIGIITAGSGVSVFKEQNGSIVTLKSLVAGTGISLTNNTNDITIAATADALTADRVMITDGDGLPDVSNVTPTELSYVSGVASPIQSQLNSKQNTITGAASTVVSLDLVADRLLVSNSAGKIAAGTIPPASLTYISTLTDYAQSQINNKLSLSGGTLTGNLTSRNITIPSPYSLIIGSGIDMTISTSGIISANLSIAFTNGALSTTNGWLGSTNGGVSFDGGTTQYRKKTINIGDWNMDSDASVSVAHGISNYKKIRKVSVLIINDADSGMYNLEGVYGTAGSDTWGSVTLVGSTSIILVRTTSSFFDGTGFDSTSFNRGYITIEYLV